MENNTNEYEQIFGQFYDDLKTLKHAVASLQRKVAFQEDVIKKLLRFVDENKLAAYGEHGEMSDAYFSGDTEFFQKEIENKTYRTYDEYYEEEYGA